MLKDEGQTHNDDEASDTPPAVAAMRKKKKKKKKKMGFLESVSEKSTCSVAFQRAWGSAVAPSAATWHRPPSAVQLHP